MIVPLLAWLLAVGLSLALGWLWLGLSTRREGEARPMTPGALWDELRRRLRRPERGDLRLLLQHVLPIVVLLGLIPLGAVAGPGAFEITLVAWDADSGLQAILAIAALAAGGALLARSAEERGRFALGGLALALPLVLCAAGLAGVAGSLRLIELVRHQDQLLRPLGLPIPAWGFFVQPLGGALLVASLAAIASVGARGPSRGALALWAPVLAMLTATLFLGGFTLPFSSARDVASLFSPVLGALAASLAVLALQLLCFAGKSALVLWAFEIGRGPAARLAVSSSPRAALSVGLPLGLLNLLLAALVVPRLEALG